MQKIVPVLCMVLLLVSSVCFAAAVDMRFVDAVDDVGYYVDVNSVNLISDTEAEASVGIIIPARNRWYIYQMHFNRAASTYQILKLTEFKYDTKEKLYSSDQPLAVKSYGNPSPIKSVVDFIYNNNS